MFCLEKKEGGGDKDKEKKSWNKACVKEWERRKEMKTIRVHVSRQCKAVS